jgi:hypothetical protein
MLLSEDENISETGKWQIGKPMPAQMYDKQKSLWMAWKIKYRSEETSVIMRSMAGDWMCLRQAVQQTYPGQQRIKID